MISNVFNYCVVPLPCVVHLCRSLPMNSSCVVGVHCSELVKALFYDEIIIILFGLSQ